MKIAIVNWQSRSDSYTNPYTRHAEILTTEFNNIGHNTINITHSTKIDELDDLFENIDIYDIIQFELPCVNLIEKLKNSVDKISTNNCVAHIHEFSVFSDQTQQETLTIANKCKAIIVSNEFEKQAILAKICNKTIPIYIVPIFPILTIKNTEIDFDRKLVPVIFGNIRESSGSQTIKNIVKTFPDLELKIIGSLNPKNPLNTVKLIEAIINESIIDKLPNNWEQLNQSERSNILNTALKLVNKSNVEILIDLDDTLVESILREHQIAIFLRDRGITNHSSVHQTLISNKMIVLANLEDDEQITNYGNKVIQIDYQSVSDISEKIKKVQFDIKTKNTAELHNIIENSQIDKINLDDNLNKYISIYEDLILKKGAIKPLSLQFQKIAC